MALKSIYFIFTIFLAALLNPDFMDKPAIAFGQSNGNNWSNPNLIFETDGKGMISYPTIISDQTGTIHVFWTLYAENEIEGNQIYYTQWKDQHWSYPVDIIYSQRAFYVSAVADSEGNIHIVWQGSEGFLKYSRAVSTEATSASAWVTPINIGETMGSGQITVDKLNRLHITYPGRGSTGPMYSYSDDFGQTWSTPSNISSTMVSDSISHWSRIAISENGTIHVAWTELQLPEGWPPVGLFYSYSNDSGQTWNEPMEIAGKGYNQANLTTAGNNVVYIVWNGMAGIQGRYYKFSMDEGKTWSNTIRLNTEGSAGSTGPNPLVVDSAGTIHMLTVEGLHNSGGILYNSLQNKERGEWVNVSDGAIGATKYIEEPSMTISTGNKLHAVFWDDRQRLWYITKNTTAPSIPPLPFSTESQSSSSLVTQTPILQLSPSHTPKVTEAILLKGLPESRNPGISKPILFGSLSVFILVGIITLSRILIHSKR